MISPPRLRAVPVGLAALSAAAIAAVWARLPLANGPQEWQWAYRPPGLAAGGLAVAVAAVGLILLAILAPPRPRTAPPPRPSLPGDQPRTAERLALAVLPMAGIAFTFGLVAAQPGGCGRVLDSLVSRNSFGFVWDAGLAPDRRALLADYPAASLGLNQHSVTHPPGPLLAVRALDRLVARLAPANPPAAPAGAGPAPAKLDALPPSDDSLAPGAEWGAGRSSLVARAGWALERARMRAANRRQPVPERLPSAWTVAVLALLLPTLSALAAWPLHLLALACGLERRAAMLAAALWLLVPARSLFTPSLDQALPLLLMTAAWLAAGRGLWRAAGAGLLLWCACFLSYGCLAALPPLGALILGTAGGGIAPAPSAADSAARSALSPARRAARNALVRLAALGGLGMLLPWAALAWCTGFDPWRAFRTAIELHHKIAVAPRGYGTWLLFNPYDFALLLGPPVLGLAALVVVRGLTRAKPALVALGWAFWAVIGALWLSGSVRGEVGRIWLPWMPFACLLAAGAWERWAGCRGGEGGGSDGATVRDAWAPALLLLAQAALALTLAANMVFVS